MDTTSAITTVVLGIAFVANILLGAIVLFHNFGKRLNQYFFSLAIAASLWVLTNLLYSVIDDSTKQYGIALVSYSAASFLGLFFLLYCFELSKANVSQTIKTIASVVGVLISLAALVPGYMASGVESDKILTNALPLNIYGAYLFLYMACGMGSLLIARAHKRGVERSKITIVLLGLLFAAIVGLFFNLLLPLTGNYEFVDIGPVATLILAASSTYAIVRHRLFDIKLAAVRTAAYIGVLLTLSGVYYLIAYILSVLLFSSQVASSFSISPINILLALLLAFLFQPIKQFFDKITDRIFYRDNYKTDEFISTLSQLLVSTTDLRGLLERASHQIAFTFKSDQVFFFLYFSNSSDHYLSAGTTHHAKLPLHDARLLDVYAQKASDNIIATDLIESDAEPLRRMLVSHGIALVVPLKESSVITGYVFLGDHMSGNYTKRDIAVLSTISNELVIAIQNAVSLHEVKELNATLQQRIDVATKELRSSNAQLKHLDEVKDEFMSMASHQLRTPLTSVKGYISMVLEGDAGKVSPMQQKLLTEAFNSSERMVGLIADFLNVSRLQTGKFLIDKAPVNIKEIVRQEVSDLNLIAHTHDQKIRLVVTKDDLPLRADAQKIHQVMMNFIDNAIYYSHPKSTILVNLERVGDSLSFTVVDTGIGVPEDEQSKLFTRFFRAKNARRQRPDGTGVGLYLARKVVNGHSGSIIFSSREGRGSTFGFKIPLDKTQL